MTEVPLAELDEVEHPMNTEDPSPSDGAKVVVGKDGLPINVIREDSHEKVPKPERKAKKRPEEEEEEEKESESEQTGKVRTRRFATIMNLLNSMLGAGILSIPNTFVNTGFIPSVILLVIMSILSLLATDILITLASQTNTKGLGEVTFHILGKWGTLILTILNLIFLITALVAYLVLAGDMITSWFDLGGIDLSPLKWHAIMELIYGLCLPIALSIPRNIKFLQYFSTLTVICISFFVVSMAIKMGLYLKDNHQINPTAKIAKIDITLFSSLSIYGLSFALPAVVLPAIKLYNPLIRKRKIVSLWAVIIGFVLFVIPGVSGYIIFGDVTDGNILKNFESNDILIIICRACFFVVVSSAYPMVSQSVQGMWSQLIFHDDQPAQLPTAKRSVVLVITNIIPLLIAMFLPSAKPALSIGGALGGCLVDFTFPCVGYLVYHKGSHKWYYYKFLLVGLFAVFGVVSAVISTYQAIVDAIAAFS